MVCAGAPPPTRTIERVEAELGWEFLQIYGLTETSPLLTINRMREEWDGLTGHERAEKLGRAGRRRWGRRSRSTRRARCWRAATRCSRATGRSRKRRRRRWRTGGSTPATAARSTPRVTW
ncbi:hypothetical protein [Nannocystis pusilla]|uniref:hypothetical protein n=1 Tax=Nannocystis pusilla TaxID=889268 RepID=UPI003B7E5539